MADIASIYGTGNLLHTQEKLSRYVPGGYHPVCLGDIFKNGRYQIHHKLGHGGFSTVWLARDRERNRWVSIKIMTADNTKGNAELHTLQALAAHSKGNPDFSHVVQLLDDFVHYGPNGSHRCLVMELLGPSVQTILAEYAEYKKDEMTLDPETVLKMSKQLLQAIAFIHQAGYAHGDLSGSNFAFTSKNLSNLTEKSLFEILEHPETEKVVRLDGRPLDKGVPKQMVQRASWDDWTDEDHEDLRITDLGEAFRHGEEPLRLAQPGPLKAPEAILMNHFDYRIDLWRAGIMIYSFVLKALPFQYLGDNYRFVSQMIGFVEELPSEWRQQLEHLRLNSQWGSKIFTNKVTLEQKFAAKVSERTLKPLLPIIQGLMRFRPSDRISASQALDMLRGPSQKGTRSRGTSQRTKPTDIKPKGFKRNMIGDNYFKQLKSTSLKTNPGTVITICQGDVGLTVALC